MRSIIPFFLLSLTMLGACAQATSSAESLTLEGRMVLKGSSPVFTPVLMTQSDGQWELQGLSRERGMALQSQTVVVTGKVVRAPTTGAVPPRLEVESIRQVKGKP